MSEKRVDKFVACTVDALMARAVSWFEQMIDSKTRETPLALSTSRFWSSRMASRREHSSDLDGISL